MGFQIVSFRLTRLVTRTKESNKFASIKSEQNFFLFDKKMRIERKKRNEDRLILSP